MTALELKDYLRENEDKMVELLEAVGFHSIKSNSKFYSFGQPDGDNPSSTIVYKDNFKAIAYTREIGEGDVFTLIMYVKGFGKFSEVIRYVHKVLGIEFDKHTQNIKTEKKANPLDMYKKYKRKTQNIEIEIHPEEVLQKYPPVPHIDFIKDNILPRTFLKFDVRYSFDSSRIIIPHRKWDTGELLGVFGRTDILNHKELEIPKYCGILPYPKSLNLYGLSENYSNIMKKGYVVVVEAEKSVMQADSFGENTLVALGCHTISKEQVKILLSLGVEIIIAMDKGVSLKAINELCKPFYKKTKVSYMYDHNNVLNGKESPTDRWKHIYYRLLEERKEYYPVDFIGM